MRAERPGHAARAARQVDHHLARHVETSEVVAVSYTHLTLPTSDLV